jgi:ABC-type transport system substrate-binding protein
LRRSAARGRRCLFWHQPCRTDREYNRKYTREYSRTFQAFVQRSPVHARPKFDPVAAIALAIGHWPARRVRAGGDGGAVRDLDGRYSADDGQPDRGAGAYQFTAFTIYDPLVAWEMDVSDRPGKLVPGLATEWKVDDNDKTKWRFTLRKA